LVLSDTPQTDKDRGLTEALVDQRREIFGLNELAEKKVNPILKFLSYFTAPMPIMIWCAAFVELIKASTTGEGWPDFTVLLILQFCNGLVGYVEETNAGNAIAALKERLAPECSVCRNGE
jgi:H+-transporting ATPase